MTTLSPDFIVQGLVQRGVPLTAAIGIAGNLSVESGFDPGINEVNPVVAGSRGGYGLAQWTGPRRRQLEAFAAQHGADVSDPNLQMDFLVWEMGNTEAGNSRDTLAATSPDVAAREFMSDFLRPGIPHADRRLEATGQIANAFGGSASAGSYGADPSIAGAFGASTLPMEDWQHGGGNALADLTMFGGASSIRQPGQIEAPERGNALAALSRAQEPAYGAAQGYGMGAGPATPQVPLSAPPALRPRVDATVQQILAAFAPRAVY